jgi:hypothetical protein
MEYNVLSKVLFSYTRGFLGSHKFENAGTRRMQDYEFMYDRLL